MPKYAQHGRNYLSKLKVSDTQTKMLAIHIMNTERIDVHQ